MAILWDNFATTVIATTTVAAGDLSFDVDVGTGLLFPSPTGGDYAVLVLEDNVGAREVVHLTARSVDTLTVTRAQEGTTAIEFSSGDRCEMRLTKGFLEDFVDGGTYSSTGFTARIRRSSTPATPPSTLLEGELAANVGDSPPTLYIGDGTSVLEFASVEEAPTGSGVEYVRKDSAWAVNPLAAAAFDAGTAMLFYQNAAPTGWTIDATNNDKAIRVVSSAGGVAGGTTAFSTIMAAGRASSSTQLSIANLPLHSHTFSGSSGGMSANAAHSHTIPVSTSTVQSLEGYATGTDGGGATGTMATNAANTDHSHTFSGTTTGTGSSTGHAHTTDMAIQYIDIIVAIKDA